MTMHFVLDRSLPVPLGVQLRGKIKYGIACGELLGGERLPSVRDMAAQVGIAPMTVAAVYRELQQAALLEARPGSGTFIALCDPPDERRRTSLHRLRIGIDVLLRDARALGLDATGVLDMVTMRLEESARDQGLRLVFVGMFEQATEDYASAIRARLAAGDRITAVTLDGLRDDVSLCLEAAGADLIVTMANRRADVTALLGPHAPPVVTVSFLPAEHVRAGLAALDPFTRVAVVSLFSDWLAIMTSGIARFAPHVTQVAGTMLGAPDLAAVLADADVVVYATGAEGVLRHLPQGATALEYRHLPDPSDVARGILPMLDGLRRKPAQEVACD